MPVEKTPPDDQKPAPKPPPPKQPPPPKAATPPKPAPVPPGLQGASALDAFMAGLANQESGNNPNAVNPRTAAHGTWQIMPGNWPSWSREAGLGPNAPKTAANQYKVARFKMQQYYDQFRSWAAVAVAWYAGPDDAVEWLRNPNQARFTRGQGPNGREPSIASYVSTAMAGMQKAGGNPGAVPGATGGGGSAAAPASSKPLTDAEIKAVIARDFGHFVAFLDMPEVGPILMKAAREGWNMARLEGALSKTNWWKTTDDQMRQWDALVKLKPAEAKKQREAAETVIRMAAGRMGVTLTGKEFDDLALNVARLGWTEDQVRGALAAKFRYGKTTGGEAGTAVAELKAIAAQYLVPLSDSTIQKWGQQLLNGQQTTDTFRAYMVEQASSLFPGLAKSLERGMTIEQYANPYRELIANTLELNPAEVNFMDPKWMRVLTSKDPKTNDHVSMTLAEAAEYARADPRFRRTRQARAQTADLLQFLGESFGRTA